MTLDELDRAIDAAGLSADRTWIREHTRSAIDVRRTDETTGRSRLGGAPDLPRGTEWPRVRGRPYRFVAQIDLADLPRVSVPPSLRVSLPSAGLLSLFVADDPSGEIDPRGELDWTSPEYAIAILSEPDAELAPLTSPDEVSFGESAHVTFTATHDLPHDRDQVPTWPWARDDERAYEAHRALRQRLHDDHLFGYPTHCSLGYDPTPKGQCPLASFSSDDALAWQWHDGDCLMLFVDPREIRVGRFPLGADCG